MIKLNKILTTIYIIIFLMVALAVAILPIASSNHYYMKQHQLNDVITNLKENCEIEITEAELKTINNNMIKYLFGMRKSMQYQLEDGKDFFSEQAISHMKDVRTLFVGGSHISIFLLIIFIGLSIYLFRFASKQIKFSKIYLITVLILIVFLIAIVCYAAIDFDHASEFFHHVIFPNQDKFQDSFFDYNDTLITVLPEQFFMKIGLIIVITYFSLIIFGYVMCRVIDHINKKNLINDVTNKID